MLRKLSGNVHEVHTGLAVVQRPRMREGVVDEVTRVTFAPLSEEEIGRYIAAREPFDKAGAYGIQGIGGRYVTQIEGCYFNVMGFLLRGFGRYCRNSAGTSLRSANALQPAADRCKIGLTSFQPALMEERWQLADFPAPLPQKAAAAYRSAYHP